MGALTFPWPACARISSSPSQRSAGQERLARRGWWPRQEASSPANPLRHSSPAGCRLFAQDTSEILPIEMAVQSESTQASVKGTVQDPFSPGRATGDFLIAGPNMALLAPLTGASFPITPPYKLTGKLDFASEVYRITDAKAQIGRSEAEGGLTVTTRPGRRPEITAEVLSHNIDLRDLGSPVGE